MQQASIKDGKFILGEVTFAADQKNILETLDTALKTDSQAWKKMADALELPCSPFDRKLLTPVILGVVQSAWYLAYEGAVPEKCLVNQERRVARYHEQIAELKASDGKDLVTSRKKPSSSGEPAATRKANLYRLVASKKEVWNGFKGQKYLMVKAMTELGAFGPDGCGVTVKAISEAVRDTPETKAPSDKNCAFHINAWTHEAIVERVEQDGDKWTVAEVQMPKSDESQPAPPPRKEEPAKPADKLATPKLTDRKPQAKGKAAGKK